MRPNLKAGEPADSEHTRVVTGVTTAIHQRNDCKPEDVVYLYTASSQACISCCLLTSKNWHIYLQYQSEMRLTIDDHR